MTASDEGGGGASRSTDPAAGSSAGTDVSLREYVAAVVRGEVRVLEEKIDSFTQLSEERWKLERASVQAANDSAERALNSAKHEADERLLAHNGLIEQMRQQAEANARQNQELVAQLASREQIESVKQLHGDKIAGLQSFQAKLTGGLLVVAAVGLANLIKVWTG